MNIAGATNASLTLKNITAADAANYDVVITGTCGNATSNTAALVVNTAPAITTQPVSLVQCTGTNATFTVAATGTGLTYQWQKNTVNIAGATNASYTLNNIAAADAGSYRVVITGTCGNLTSSAATLTVNTAPAITGQPASLMLCTGANASVYSYSNRNRTYLPMAEERSEYSRCNQCRLTLSTTSRQQMQPIMT